MMRGMRWECCGCCMLYTTNVVLRGGLPRLTSIGVAYLEVRELGCLSPSTSSLQRLYTLGDTTSPWGGVRAMALAHGPDSSCGPTALLFSKSTWQASLELRVPWPQKYHHARTSVGCCKGIHASTCQWRAHEFVTQPISKP
jgi:hypothetical protein